jgi:hypothetical protein
MPGALPRQLLRRNCVLLILCLHSSFATVSRCRSPHLADLLLSHHPPLHPLTILSSSLYLQNRPRRPSLPSS